MKILITVRACCRLDCRLATFSLILAVSVMTTAISLYQPTFQVIINTAAHLILSVEEAEVDFA